MQSRAVALAVVLLASVACTGPYSQPSVSAKEEKPLSVQTFRAALETIPEVIAATGELLAEEQATIGARVPGRVTRLHVDLGSTAQAGQVLAEIEKDDYEFRVRQAEALVSQIRARLGILDKASDDVNPDETAVVRQAAAALREARFVYETTSSLYKEGVMSRIDFEKAGVRRQAAEAAFQAAREEVMQLKAQLAERRAQLELARQNLADCLIRAPFSGAVTRRHASLGEYLAVNAPVVTLVRQHPLRIRLEIPERFASRIRAGQRIDVHLEGAVQPPSGRVVRLSPSIEAQSRSLTIEGEIPNERGLLRPGSFVAATVTVDPYAQGLAVPRSSVVSFAGVDRVFIVRNGVLEDRIVRLGRPLPFERVQVLSGLEPGVLVVRNAHERMMHGRRAVVQ